MNLVVNARDVLAGISPQLVDEFDRILSRINFVWSRNHNQQTGEHKNLAFDTNTITQATVGAAGSASALPATPSGYLNLTIGGAQYVVPFYRAV